MQFGSAIATACATFAVTNIDDIFVLVTFFAEASTSRNLTPLKIVIGQYVGFSIIILISMIGYAVSFVLPSEPIGFLGLLPILLGIWKAFDVIFPAAVEGEEGEKQTTAAVRSVLKVSSVTLMNGGDNVGTYVPLFSQAKGAEIAVYIVVYYILLGIWCLAAFLIMKQKPILAVAQKYADFVVPFLYMGLGVYIIVDSSCYPWSIEQIDESASKNVGQTTMAVTTTVILLACIGLMIWRKLKKQRRQQQQQQEEEASDTEDGRVHEATEDGNENVPTAELHVKGTAVALQASAQIP